jgi:hypothetical protein
MLAVIEPPTAARMRDEQQGVRRRGRDHPTGN